MGFTEVTFELSDPHHPLCRWTRPPTQAHAVVRPMERGLRARDRTHIAFRGPPEAGAELAAALRAAAPQTTVEILDQRADHTGLLVEVGLDGGAPTGFAGIGQILAKHGIDAVIDPLIAIEGKIRARLAIPREVDPQEILRALQDVQRTLGVADFRITRIAPLSPGAHVEMARRALPPDHEALLALAASMGYYETPKAVTLERIAQTVGLSISPVHKKLKAAEEAIVAQHMATPRVEVRRRPRREPRPADEASPWEVQVRARGDLGPVNILETIPDARASLHALPHDAAHGRSRSSLLVLVAPDDAQQRIIRELSTRSEIDSVSLIGRSSAHAACRLITRESGLYSLSWWHTAWGEDGAVRAVVFERGEARVRAVVARASAAQTVEERVQGAARLAGWTDWEIEGVRSLSDGAVPPAWPEPLTHRQDEVLRIAHALGYYRTPRGCTLEDVAKTLGVSANAVHKNLVLAESKLISAYLAAGV